MTVQKHKKYPSASPYHHPSIHVGVVVDDDDDDGDPYW